MKKLKDYPATEAFIANANTARENLRKTFGIKIIKDDSKKKPLYVVEGGKLYQSFSEGIKAEIIDGGVYTGSFLSDVSHVVRADMNIRIFPLFRGTSGDNSETILKIGSDFPGMKKGGQTYATDRIEKACRYRNPTRITISNEVLEGDRCLTLYDPFGLKPDSLDKTGYLWTFVRKPIDALLGVILFKST